MHTFSGLLRSRIGIAVFGVLLIGGLGGYLGAASGAHPRLATNSGNNGNSGNVAQVGTAASSSSSTAPTTGNPSPTDTTAANPTAPTNTGGTGQVIDLHGTIGTIDPANSSFILNVNGAPTTVVVNGQTSFQGSATSLQGLQTGWLAEVKGQMQSDGTFRGYVVNSDSGR